MGGERGEGRGRGGEGKGRGGEGREGEGREGEKRGHRVVLLFLQICTHGDLQNTDLASFPYSAYKNLGMRLIQT